MKKQKIAITGTTSGLGFCLNEVLSRDHDVIAIKSYREGD